MILRRAGGLLRPGEEQDSSPRLELLGAGHLPWALLKILQVFPQIKSEREVGGGSTPRRQPRMRRCLLKGCKKRYRPRRARQRYCSPECGEAARVWRRWKAQQRYRATAAGHEKRNGQSRRYRERVRSRKAPEPEAVSEAARVITPEYFFRFIAATGRAATSDSLTQRRSPLQRFCSHACRTRAGACPGTGAALETGARLNPEILIRRRRRRLTFSLSACNWSFINSIGAGNICGCDIQRDRDGCWLRWPKPGNRRPLWWWLRKIVRPGVCGDPLAGDKRIAALEQVGWDTVEAVVWQVQPSRSGAAGPQRHAEFFGTPRPRWSRDGCWRSWSSASI